MTPDKAENLSLGGDEISVAQTEAFEATLYPILQKNCAGCHGDDQSPLFALSNTTLGQKEINRYNLVDLDTPETSLIVRKIRGGHQSFETSLADTLEKAIGDWSLRIVQR